MQLVVSAHSFAVAQFNVLNARVQQSFEDARMMAGYEIQPGSR